jgi:hypothetical protein
MRATTRRVGVALHGDTGNVGTVHIIGDFSQLFDEWAYLVRRERCDFLLDSASLGDVDICLHVEQAFDLLADLGDLFLPLGRKRVEIAGCPAGVHIVGNHGGIAVMIEDELTLKNRRVHTASPNGNVDGRVVLARLEPHGARRPDVGFLFLVGREIRAEGLHQRGFERNDFGQGQHNGGHVTDDCGVCRPSRY